MASGKHESDTARGAREDRLALMLAGAITEQETRLGLAITLLALDDGGRRRLRDRLGDDASRVLDRLADAARSGVGGGAEPPRVEPTVARLEQEWASAWADWGDCIGESGDEEGLYCVREHHWEDPYVDTAALAGDLERAAEKIEPLIDQVIGKGADPGFSFVGAIEESASDLGAGLPEWFGEPDWDGCLCGPRTTACLLRWERLAALRARGPGESGAEPLWLDRVRHAEARAERWELDAEALADFLLGLPDEEQRGVQAWIAARQDAVPWSTALQSVHSGWFRAMGELSRRWSPGDWLRICRANVGNDWSLALPVLEDLLARSAASEAQPVFDAAITSLLRPAEGHGWDPERELLLRRLTEEYRLHREEERVPTLLDLGARVARDRGAVRRAFALALQAAAVRLWQDWDAVLAVFAGAGAGDFADVAERLFADWRLVVSRQSAGAHAAGVVDPATNWVPLLVDAARLGPGSAPRFREDLVAWLGRAGADAGSFGAMRPALETLTLDLGRGGALHETSPALEKMLDRHPAPVSALAESRRGWLDRLGARDLFPAAVAVWRRQAASLVADPGSARGSYYDDCAGGLALVFELDEPTYRRIIDSWSIVHRRRSNLWKAIAARGLPVGGQRRR